MSNRSSPCRGEDEELDLALEFQGLRITVRGSAERAASFVQRLAGSPEHRGVPGPSDLGTGQQLPQRQAVSSAPSVASWQEIKPATPPPRRETRDSIEASFTTCPGHLRLLASSLSTTSGGWTPEQRLQRAWKAGQWAGAVRSGRVQSPNRTPTIDAGNRFYAVVRGPNISSPRVFKTTRELFSAVSALEGVTATQYLERFGGFGRTKDIGFIIWQVAQCLNHLQEENYMAAKDALSLLFVCLEQTAMDNGKMEVGLLLALVEDPPYSLFSGRSVAVSANPRPFAPTANQRWVTTALQYLKEMDVITSRRAEVTSTKQSAADNPPHGPGPKKKGKGKGGPKAKAGPSQSALEEE